MNGTTVTTSTSGHCFVETHRTQTVRYFNGRKYVTQNCFDFFEFLTTGDYGTLPGHTFAVYYRYTTVNPGSHRIGHVYKQIHGAGPTNLMRAMRDMVPDEIQAVPF